MPDKLENLSEEKRKLFERFWCEECRHDQENRPGPFWPPEFEQNPPLFKEYRCWRSQGLERQLSQEAQAYWKIKQSD